MAGPSSAMLKSTIKPPNSAKLLWTCPKQAKSRKRSRSASKPVKSRVFLKIETEWPWLYIRCKGGELHPRLVMPVQLLAPANPAKHISREIAALATAIFCHTIQPPPAILILFGPAEGLPALCATAQVAKIVRASCLMSFGLS